jgi:hypothetical protein
LLPCEQPIRNKKTNPVKVRVSRLLGIVYLQRVYLLYIARSIIARTNETVKV